MAFLFGVGTGSLENQMVTCPACGAYFQIEETRLISGKPSCPACLEPVDEPDSGQTDRHREEAFPWEEDEHP